MKSTLMNKAQAAGAQVAQHTPGPWIVELEEGPDGIEDIAVKFPGYDGSANGRPKAVDPFRIATVNSVYFGCHDAEAKANSRLIAAAPELLEALKALVNDWGLDETVMEANWEQARAAIAKAEGKL